jgi:hypothetical protein
MLGVRDIIKMAFTRGVLAVIEPEEHLEGGGGLHTMGSVEVRRSVCV